MSSLTVKEIKSNFSKLSNSLNIKLIKGNKKIFNIWWIILNLICIKWVPGDPSTIFLANSFTQKMPERSDFMYSSILMLENI